MGVGPPRKGARSHVGSARDTFLSRHKVDLEDLFSPGRGGQHLEGFLLPSKIPGPSFLFLPLGLGELKVPPFFTHRVVFF